MSIARTSLTNKVNTKKAAYWLNKTAVLMGCRVFVDHAGNIILAGKTEKAHRTAEVLKAYGSARVRSEMEVRRGVSFLFLYA